MNKFTLYFEPKLKAKLIRFIEGHYPGDVLITSVGHTIGHFASLNIETTWDHLQIQKYFREEIVGFLAILLDLSEYKTYTGFINGSDWMDYELELRRIPSVNDIKEHTTEPNQCRFVFTSHQKPVEIFKEISSKLDIDCILEGEYEKQGQNYILKERRSDFHRS